MVTPDEMVNVDGRRYRPEDVPGKDRSAVSSDGHEVATGPVTADRMVVIDGIKYRPEDVPAHAREQIADDDTDDDTALQVPEGDLNSQIAWVGDAESVDERVARANAVYDVQGDGSGSDDVAARLREAVYPKPDGAPVPVEGVEVESETAGTGPAVNEETGEVTPAGEPLPVIEQEGGEPIEGGEPEGETKGEPEGEPEGDEPEGETEGDEPEGETKGEPEGEPENEAVVLKGAALDEALGKAGLSKSGTVAEKRARLAEAKAVTPPNKARTAPTK